MDAATCVICAFSLSKVPKEASMARASAPVGRPPAWGARLRQKMECRTWPDRLKASDRSRPAIRV
jgi:hypothetical protein